MREDGKDESKTKSGTEKNNETSAALRDEGRGTQHEGIEREPRRKKGSAKLERLPESRLRSKLQIERETEQRAQNPSLI